MKRVVLGILTIALASMLVLSGCSQAAPAPSPTKAPEPAKAAEPAKVPEPAKAATAAPQPTAVPAQKTDFPAKNKTVEIIVGYPAGGATDVGARVLAPLLEKELGTPVQVVNKAGAGGQVGLTELARAKPDGYTLGYTTLPPVVTTYLDPRRQAVFDRKSFDTVALHVFDPGTVAVRADSPYKTFEDVINAAKANPEQVSASTTGIGNTPHLMILGTENLMKVKFATVHFEGNAPAITALLGGHVDVAFDTSGIFMPHVKSGAVRLLGIMDKNRSKFYPDLPTMEEQGHKLYYAASRGLSLPAGTPKPIIDTLSSAIARAMENPEHIKKMEDSALMVRYMNPDEFGAYWDDMEIQMKPLMDALIAAK